MQAAAQNLIPVFSGSINDEQAQLVDARTLYRFLQVDARFNDWIARRIAEYGFQDGQDFYSALSKSTGGRRSREYHVTLDMAKELSMVERNDKGRQARRYFIECEKRLQHIAPQEAETIRGQTIGTDGFHCLAAVLDGKLRLLKGGAKRAAKNHVWQQVHRAFSVVRAEDIPADQLDSARCFIAAYDVREGEFIEAEKPKQAGRLDIHYPVECLIDRRPDMLGKYSDTHDRLTVTLTDLNHRHESPCEQIMHTLANAGYDVDGAFWEIRTFRNKAEAFDRALSHLSSVFDGPQEYVINKIA